LLFGLNLADGSRARAEKGVPNPPKRAKNRQKPPTGGPDEKRGVFGQVLVKFLRIEHGFSEPDFTEYSEEPVSDPNGVAAD